MARDLTVLGEVQSGVMGPVRIAAAGVDEFTSLFVDDFGAASSSSLIGKAVTWDDGNNRLKLTDSGEVPIGLIAKVWPVTIAPTAIKRVQVQSTGIFTKSSWGLLSTGSNYYISGAGNGALAAATTYPESNEALVGYCIDSENLLLNFSGFNGETVVKQRKIRELLELVDSVHSGSNDGTLALTGTLGLFPLTVATLVYPTLEVSKLQSTALHNGDGPSIVFTLGTPTQVPAQTMASIEVTRDGANNEGTMAFKAGTNGAEEFFRLDASLNSIEASKDFNAYGYRVYSTDVKTVRYLQIGGAVLQDLTILTGPSTASLNEYSYKVLISSTVATLNLPAAFTTDTTLQPVYRITNKKAGTVVLVAAGTGIIYGSGVGTYGIPTLKTIEIAGIYVSTNQINWHILQTGDA